MFNNYNNPQQTPSANTRVTTLYSELSCLQIGLWDNKLSIKMNLATGKTPEGRTVYDFDNRINTAITPDKAASLLHFAETTIIPKMDEVEAGGALEKPIGISFDVGNGKTSRVSLEYKADENGVPSAYLVIYTNIVNGKTNNVAQYKFNKGEMFKCYNNETGEVENVTATESEFLAFVNTLRFIPSVQGFSYHTDKWYSMTAKNFQSQNQGQNSNGGSYNAPVSDYSGPDDDLPF